MQLPALSIDTSVISSPRGVEIGRLAREEGRQIQDRNLLKEVGQIASAGPQNYLEAAQKAMAGGELDTGLSLIKTKQAFDAADTEKRLKLLDFFGRGAEGADTPEKWSALINMAQGVYGPDTDLSQYSDFGMRDQVRAFLTSTKENIERERAHLELAKTREELADKREGRAFRRDVLSSFGLTPSTTSTAVAPPPTLFASPSTQTPTPMAGAPPPSAPQIQPPLAQAPSASAPQPATPAPPSTADVVAKMTPAQRTSLGLLIAKEDYAGASKLLQEVAQGNETAPYKDMKQKAEVEEGLRKEIAATNKDYAVIRDYSAKIEEVAKAPSAASDMAMIFAFMKLLDPSSVVRETEYANAENARGVPEYVTGIWNRLQRGERLTENQRQDFLNQALTLARLQRNQYARSMQKYRGIANRLKLDERNVIVDLDMLQTEDVLNEAREAIKKGADPNAVKQRLLDNGIDPAGL